METGRADSVFSGSGSDSCATAPEEVLTSAIQTWCQLHWSKQAERNQWNVTKSSSSISSSSSLSFKNHFNESTPHLSNTGLCGLIEVSG